MRRQIDTAAERLVAEPQLTGDMMKRNDFCCRHRFSIRRCPDHATGQAHQSRSDKLPLVLQDRKALLEALTDLQREKNTGCIAKQASACAESVTDALFNVLDCWLNPELLIRNSNTP